MSKPVIISTFATNDLSNVKVEAEKIWGYLDSCPQVEAIKIENADVDTLAEQILEHEANLYFFHFGGHAEQKKVVLDGFFDLDRVRLARMLMPRNKHNLQWVFLNGCLSYGHVALLTTKGVKAVIATNVSIDDEEAARMAKFFYQCFFIKKMTLAQSFQFAESTVSGRNSHIVQVNPGELDEDQAMPSSWTLFVHTQHAEVLNWTLDNFISGGTTNNNPVEDKSLVNPANNAVKSPELLEFQREAKQKIIKGTDEAIKFLEERLNTGEATNHLGLLKAEWQEFRKEEMLGLIDFNQKQQKANTLRYKVMTFIDSLSGKDLR